MAVDRLYRHPEDVSKVIAATAAGSKWTDTTFTGDNTVLYPGFVSSSTESVFNTNKGSGKWFF